MNTRLNYRIEGEGTPLLWIHGFPFSSSIFDSVTSIAGAKHILIDLPGFGKTASDPGIVSMDDFATAVLATLDELQIDCAVIAGLSMGGYLALAIARIAPERLRALILIDTRETADSEDARVQRTASAKRVAEEGIDFLVAQMRPKMLTSATTAERPHIATKVEESMKGSTSVGVIGALSAMRDRESSAAVLAAITVPILVVVGAEDTITPPADAERMARNARNATLSILPSAAHLSHIDQPDLFRDAVERFLKAISGRDSAASPLVRNLVLIAALAGSMTISGCQEEEIAYTNKQMQTIENTEVAPAPVVAPPEVDTTETERKFSQTERIALSREGKFKDGQLLVEAAPRLSLPFTPAIAMDPVDGSKLSITTLTPTFEYEGKIYYFSSTGNRSTFIGDPNKYSKGALSRY